MEAPAAWEIRSDTTKNTLLGAGILLAGSLFILLTHGQATQSRDTLAAFWLGVLLAGLGAGSLILGEELEVGPWCPAMWFGTAPPVIMVATFAILLGLFRRFWR